MYAIFLHLRNRLPRRFVPRNDVTVILSEVKDLKNGYEEDDFSVVPMCCRDCDAGAGKGLAACDVLECGEFL